MIYDRRFINRVKDDHCADKEHMNKINNRDSLEGNLNEKEKFRFQKELFGITLLLFVIILLISELINIIAHH